jgi:shikimate kinase
MSGTRNGITYVTGLSGSGKSSVLAACRDAAKIIDFSDLLKARISRPFEEWDLLDDEAFNREVSGASDELVAAAPALAAGHVFAVRHGERLLIEHAWDRLLPCHAVVWLSASPDRLMSRRPNQRRERAQLELDEGAALDFLMRRCLSSATPLVILRNDDPEDLDLSSMFVREILVDSRSAS